MAISNSGVKSVRRLLKYAGVSVAVVPLTQSLLVLFYSVVKLPGTAANALAVAIAAIPGYLLNRRWVWGKTSDHSFSREIAPFWGMNLLGLLLSSIMVGWVDSFTNNALVLVAANILVFGVLWLVKFLLLDQWMFGPGQPVESSQLSQV